MFAIPPGPDSGGHHMVLQYTVLRVTHLMITTGCEGTGAGLG